MTCPCYKCSDRRLKCHADCEKYKAFRDEYEELKQAMRVDSDYISYRANKKAKREKEQKYHKRS